MLSTASELCHKHLYYQSEVQKTFLKDTCLKHVTFKAMLLIAFATPSQVSIVNIL